MSNVQLTKFIVFKEVAGLQDMENERISEKATAWLIDHDEDFSFDLGLFLNDSPDVRCVAIFPSCEQALRAVLRGAEPPAVILSDIDLEGMSGLDGLRFLRELVPTTHLILLTEDADIGNVKKAIDLKASGYLLKQSSALGEILEAIRTVVRGGAVWDPFILPTVLQLLHGMPKEAIDELLTRREKEIVRLAVAGLSRRETANILCAAHSTVITHFKNIYRKLEVHSREELVEKALKYNLV